MKKILLFPLLLIALATIVSCDDDDKKSVIISETVKGFIETKYPGASIRKAEYENNGLLEVEFIHQSLLKDAYFKSNNEWVYTEWDIAISKLPKNVTDAIAEAYPSHRIDDVDYVEAPSGNYYEVEIEKGGSEAWIYVTPEGIILEGGIDSDRPIISESIKSFINERYPEAIIHSAEYEQNNLLEIEISHNKLKKNVYFDTSDKWVYSEWEISANMLPDNVVVTLLQGLSDYRVDDVNYVENATEYYYVISLEKGNIEKTFIVKSNGDIIPV